MLWVGAAGVMAAQRMPLARRDIVAATALAGLPDVLQLLPAVGWALFGSGSWQALLQLAVAVPGQEPALPPAVALATHHLHCVAHSAIVAAGVSLLMWALLRRFWWPLLGWWAHIVIDVFTHSAEFYPSPVLYPITYRGFDGIAWNEPWFMLLNYAALGAFCLWVAREHRRRQGRRGGA